MDFEVAIIGAGAAGLSAAIYGARAGMSVALFDQTMAGGQTVALKVEEQLPGSDQWREVRGDAVSWDVPAGVIWESATESLRPAVTVPHGTGGTLKFTAKYRDQSAVATIQTGKAALDPADASVRLVLECEPEGRYLPVGKQQLLGQGGLRYIAQHRDRGCFNQHHRFQARRARCKRFE